MVSPKRGAGKVGCLVWFLLAVTLVYFGITGLSTSGNMSITFFLGLTVLMKVFPAQLPASKSLMPA